MTKSGPVDRTSVYDDSLNKNNFHFLNRELRMVWFENIDDSFYHPSP
jgi:hypothetical protein